MLLAPAFRNLDAALEEASHISGASGRHTFFHIFVPVMMPAILISTILGIIRSLEAFEIELLLGTPIGLQVFSTKIHELVTWEPPQFAPAMALSTVFLGLLLFMVAMQRRYIGKRNYATITGRGFSIRSMPLGKWRYPAFALILSFALIITVLPTVLLIAGTFMKLFGFFNIADPWTLDNWRATLSDPVLMRSLWNTIAVGLGSGVIGIFFYALIAYVIEGCSGLPFFAGGGAGLLRFFGPTGGYLVAFPAAAFIVGAFAEHGWDKRYVTAVAAMAIGSLIIFLGGWAWYAILTNTPPVAAIKIAVAPYLLGDVIKIALAAAVLPTGWALLKK